MNADTVEINSNLKYLWLVCVVNMSQDLDTVALLLISISLLSYRSW